MSMTKTKNYDKLLQEVILEAKQLNIPVSQNIHPNIIVNSRAKKRFGLCKRKGNEFIIEISSIFHQAESKMVKQTLAHEVLHTCPDCFDHQYLWRTYANKMNRAYGYNISRTGSYENLGVANIVQETYRFKYTIICQSCNRKSYRERISNLIKHPERYKCKCGGRIIVQERSKF